MKTDALSMDNPRITPFTLLNGNGKAPLCCELDLSVVIPVCDEQDNIPVLYEELHRVLEEAGLSHEIIFVDDGSMDGSNAVIEDICERDPRVRLIEFSRNYGQTAALSAGFKYSMGKVVVTLDGDLQNDPADIPVLLETMSKGYDLVNGWRKDRQDAFLNRKLPSFIANKLINKLIAGTGVRLNDYGCTLKAYKSGLVKNISLYGEMHRFVPVFAAWLGARITEIPVHHRPRVNGRTKYNLSRISRVIFDLIVVRFFSDYLTRPIQFFGKIAKRLFLLSFLGLGGLLGLKLSTGLPLSYDTLFILGGIAFFSCMQVVFMGLLCEILIRSYFENQDKDSFVVRRFVNPWQGGD